MKKTLKVLSELKKVKIEKLFKAKEKVHKDLAKLPFEKKIEILVHLQEIANNIRGAIKQKSRVWKLKK